MIARPLSPSVAVVCVLLALLAISVHGHWRESERVERLCGQIQAIATETTALQALLQECAGF